MAKLLERGAFFASELFVSSALRRSLSLGKGPHGRQRATRSSPGPGIRPKLESPTRRLQPWGVAVLRAAPPGPTAE
eukprot:187071-Alexandrium_andersonii.AAC.1